MKKLIFTIVFISAALINGFAQVGIGTATPNPSSVLDLNSTNKAFIPPRMTTAQRNAIPNPTAGMVIYNTETTCIEIYRGSTWFNLCGGSNPQPPIDGFNSSDEVKPGNLIGYWPFDGTTTEKVHGSAPVLTGGTSSFVAGRIGQGIHFNNGWLTYPAAATGAGSNNTGFNSNDTLANGFTITLWTQVPDTSLLTNLFQLSNAGVPNWPLAGLAYRKHAGAPSSSFDLDGGIANVDGTGTHPTYGDAFKQPAFNDSLSWAFVAMTYDTTGGGHKLNYYSNGIKRGTIDLTTIANKPFPGPPSPVQDLLMVAPNYATIGTFESTATTPGGAGTIPSFMSAGITGTIDDIRFYNTALSCPKEMLCVLIRIRVNMHANFIITKYLFLNIRIFKNKVPKGVGLKIDSFR